jgi:hypothetical protein
MVVRIAGKRTFMWRAVEKVGEVLDVRGGLENLDRVLSEFSA